jgi:maltose O-acetyltransferase
MGIRALLKKLVFRLRGEVTLEDLKKCGLKVGNNFSAQAGYNLDLSHCWLISIGNDVTLAPKVQVLAHDASTCKYLGYAKIGGSP